MYHFKSEASDPLKYFDTGKYGISSVYQGDGLTLIASSEVLPGLERIGIETYEKLLADMMKSQVIQDNDPEPTQLDRIEEAVNKSNEEIANSAIDAYTLELMESGVL